MNKIDKVLGCLVAAATGDAMGAPTELRTRRQIELKFNGYVNDFLTPPDDTFARGGNKGEVTDDFSLAYVTLEQIIKNKGKINNSVAVEALIEWSKTSKYFDRFAGPTTRAAIAKLKNEEVQNQLFIPVNDNTKATNGLGMKLAPISLFAGTNVDLAIENAIIIGLPTHDNQIALSAGCAIAAATSTALMDNVSIYEIVQAGIYGAKIGEERGKKIAKTLAGPSVVERIKLAVTIGMNAKSLNEAIDDLADLIGSGLHAAEAIPTVFGLIVASKGNTMEAIKAAVNIGSDTDTVATMVGGILGALNGIQSIPSEYIEILEKSNGFDFDKISKGILEYGEE